MSLNTKIRGLQIKDADISATQLGTDAVETAKIKNLNVTRAKLEADIIDSTKLADVAVDSEHIVAGAVDNAHLAGSIAYGKLVLTGAILNADLAGSIAFGKLADVLDEDNMVSDSAVKLATQQSIKAYVDAQIAVDTFLELTDTPASFVGQAGKGVRVNATPDGLEFYTIVDTDEKVKADAGASAEYLDAIVDASSIEITAGDKLGVKALGITNAMLAGSIAYSKLVLTGAILNADLAGSIAYGKLVLTGAILNADLAGSIADDKLVEDYVKENQIQKATFAGDGVTVIFDVGDVPIANSVMVYLNGLLQEVGSGKDYTLATDTVTFATAPVSGDFIQIHSIKA